MLKKLRNLNFSFDPRAALIVFGTLLFGVLLGWMLRGVLVNPANLAWEAVYDTWHTGCAARNVDKGGCEMFTVITDANNAPVARINFAHQDNKLMVAVTLPLGVALPPGMGFSFDEDSKDAPLVLKYRTCNADGCIATAAVDDKLSAAFAKGKTGHILFISALQTDQKTTSINFSLSGYNQSLATLDSGEAKRKSLWWRLWS